MISLRSLLKTGDTGCQLKKWSSINNPRTDLNFKNRQNTCFSISWGPLSNGISEETRNTAIVEIQIELMSSTPFLIDTLYMYLLGSSCRDNKKCLYSSMVTRRYYLFSRRHEGYSSCSEKRSECCIQFNVGTITYCTSYFKNTNILPFYSQLVFDSNPIHGLQGTVMFRVTIPARETTLSDPVINLVLVS